MEHWVEYAGLFLLAMVCVELYRNGTQNEATLEAILEELRELKWRQLREKDKDPPHRKPVPPVTASETVSRRRPAPQRDMTTVLERMQKELS